MKLEVRSLEKIYGRRDGTTQALAPTSFDVADGEFVSLIGPSGCGGEVENGRLTDRWSCIL